MFGDSGADCVLCLGIVVLIAFWWFGMVMTVFYSLGMVMLTVFFCLE